MKHWMLGLVLVLTATATVATAEAPAQPETGTEVAAAAPAVTVETLFEVESATPMASTFQCWITCDDGTWTVTNASGLRTCGQAARNFCAGQGCEFTINNITSSC